LADERFEFDDIDGFGEMCGEAGGSALLDVLFGSPAAQADSLKGMPLAQLGEQMHSIAVGESYVANEQVDFEFVRHFDGAADAVGDGDGMAGFLKQMSQGGGGVGMILDQKNPEGTVLSRRARRGALMIYRYGRSHNPYCPAQKTELLWLDFNK